MIIVGIWALSNILVALLTVSICVRSSKARENQQFLAGFGEGRKSERHDRELEHELIATFPRRRQAFLQKYSR